MLATDRFFFIFLLVLAGAGLAAQNYPGGIVDWRTIPFVRAFEGSLGEKQSIVVVLTNWGDNRLTGSCRYLATGNTIELYGSFSQKDQFEIREYQGARQLGVFDGRFLSADTLGGTWSDPAGDRELSFALHGRPEKTDGSPWTGTWYLNDPWDEGRLIIGNVDSDSLHFGLLVVRGTHLGQVEGRAFIQGSKAFFSSALFGEEPCQFSFSLGDGYVDVEQLTGATHCGFGIRAHANGRFEEKARQVSPELTVGGDEESAFRTNAQRDGFRRVIGEQLYHLFAYNMQGVAPRPPAEGDPPGSRAVQGAANGLYATNQAILMHDEQGNFWGLTTNADPSGEMVIEYVTNAVDWHDRLPPNLESWYRSFFEGIPLQRHFFPSND